MPKKEASAPPGYTTVSIYDQAYHLMGQDTEHIRRLAEQVDTKMRAVAAQGRTVDSLRVAVLAALNLADELAQATGGASTTSRDGHARALTLKGLLDQVLEDPEHQSPEPRSPEQRRKTGS